MSKIFVDAFEKRTGGTEMAVPATGKWAATQIADGSVTDTEYQYINTLSSNAQTQISAKVSLTGGTMLGTLTTAQVSMEDNILERPVVKDYAEIKVAMAAHTVDLSLGNVQTYTLSGAQTLVFSNPPATGTSGSFTLIVTNGGSATLTWPPAVDWAAATAPTLTAAGIDVLVFTTIDGGTIWYGFLAGAALA